VESPFEAVFEAIEAAKAETIFEAVFEAIEAAGAETIEAAVEDPRPWAEGAAEAAAVEARADHVRNSPAHVLRVNLAGSPQHYQERQGPHTEG
jgi:hypothetical protein